MKNSLIGAVIERFGGQANLAQSLGVKQGAISQWLNSKTNMRERHALKIEKLTAGEFKAVDLCPRLAEIEAVEPTQSKTPNA